MQEKSLFIKEKPYPWLEPESLEDVPGNKNGLMVSSDGQDHLKLLRCVNTRKLILPPGDFDGIDFFGQEVCIASGGSKSSLADLWQTRILPSQAFVLRSV